ncbi:MAG: hypothetical protein GX130_02015 [Candidatus Hydrogenedens sp.]|jgi:hypothetical protein|nr:hypothetical protein [Candidatus Hydrogenedens sp.]
METKTYWEIFTNNQDPAEFIWYYGQGDSIVAVENFLTLYPSFLGIMRIGSWKETFSSEVPEHKDTVRFALRLHLEDTRESWGKKIEELRYLQMQQVAEEKARREAEALAAAVAKVEEEARERDQIAVNEEADSSAPVPEPTDHVPAAADNLDTVAQVPAECAQLSAADSQEEAFSDSSGDSPPPRDGEQS